MPHVAPEESHRKLMHMDEPETFGTKIREFREAKDFSLRELAKRIGVSAPFLSDVELGRRYPSDDTLRLLATELGVTEDELRSHDFRNEADRIKRMMFNDAAAGLAFRSVADSLRKGMSPEEILKRLSSTENNDPHKE